MFESTIDILFERPETVIALLPALYVTGKTVWNVRKPLMYVVAGISLLWLFPVFVLFVIGGFTKSAMWTGLGIDLFRFEASIVVGLVHFYDTMLAAWLRVFALVVHSLLSISLFQPETWTTVLHTVLQSWILVFVLHFAAGVVLVYGLYRGVRTATTETLLRVGGSMLLIAALFVVLLQNRVVEFGSPTIGVLLVAVVGLEMGVGAVLLGVGPDFSRETETDETFDEDNTISGFREVLSRLEIYAQRFRLKSNDE
jgi:hypothetical protein